jgi:translation initiation factor IF-3
MIANMMLLHYQNVLRLSIRAKFDIIFLSKLGGDIIPPKNYVVNGMIRFKEVRVIDSDGSQIGVLPTPIAISKAEEKGFDLILISPDASPPVCRIADLGKLRYEQMKKDRQARKGSKGGQLKEIKLSPKIGGHDFQVKAERAKEFLEKGFKVKVSLMFRGREATHPEIGRRHLEKMAEFLDAAGKPEGPISSEGRNMLLIISPK